MFAGLEHKGTMQHSLCEWLFLMQVGMSMGLLSKQGFAGQAFRLHINSRDLLLLTLIAMGAELGPTSAVLILADPRPPFISVGVRVQ